MFWQQWVHIIMLVWRQSAKLLIVTRTRLTYSSVGSVSGWPLATAVLLATKSPIFKSMVFCWNDAIVTRQYEYVRNLQHTSRLSFLKTFYSISKCIASHNVELVHEICWLNNLASTSSHFNEAECGYYQFTGLKKPQMQSLTYLRDGGLLENV